MRRRITTMLVALLVVLLVVSMGTGCRNTRKKVEEKAAEVAEKAVAKVIEKAYPSATPTDEPKQEGRPEPTATPTEIEAEQAEATSTPKPEGKEPEMPPATPTPTPEVSEGLVPETFDGWDKLESYELHIETTVIRDGESEDMEQWLKFVREPPAHSIRTRFFEDGKEHTVEAVRVGKTTWTSFDGGEWMAMTQSSGITGAGELMTIARGFQFSKLTDCKNLGRKVIDSLDTVHYRCDQTTDQWKSSAMAPEILEGQMDAWVWTKLGVIIEADSDYRIKDYEDKIVELHMKMKYSKINQRVVIDRPEGAEEPGPGDDVPLIEGATDVTIIGPMTTYKVAKSVDEVVEFYQEGMKENGWEADVQGSIPGMVLAFTKGPDRKVQVMTAPEGEGAQVTIVSEGK